MNSSFVIILLLWFLSLVMGMGKELLDSLVAKGGVKNTLSYTSSI